MINTIFPQRVSIYFFVDSLNNNSIIVSLFLTVKIFINKSLILENKEEYNKKLQQYVDKIKELKSWKNKSDDDETKGYLTLEIDKLLREMKELVNERDSNFS